jgi:hypothetical protein
MKPLGKYQVPSTAFRFAVRRLRGREARFSWLLDRSVRVRGGFTLVITIMLMVLIAVLAVAMLSLSVISLRTSGQAQALSVAQNNARLGLMLAIGDLQSSLGPDKAISAKASVVHDTPGQPHMLGAWQGYGWKAPDGAPPVSTTKQTKFLRWLTSSRDLQAREQLAYAASDIGSDTVFLVNSKHTGVLPDINPEIKAQRVPLAVGSMKGGLAYAVADESMKAPVSMEDNKALDLTGNYAERVAAPAACPKVLHKSLALKTPARVITLGTAEIDLEAEKKEVRARYQDLTTGSYGLLTDPVNGGLKTDLTPLMELGTAVKSADVWVSEGPYFTTNDGAPSWDFLRSYHQLYRRATSVGTPTILLASNTAELKPITGSVGQIIKPTTASVLPVIAKLQILFSMVSHYHHIGDRVNYHDSQAVPVGNINHAVPHLVYEAFVTLYNPYDVQIELPSLRVRISDPPVGFQFMKHDLQAARDSWYRQEYASGEFQGLARQHIQTEHNPDARKYFTLHLKGKTTGGTPGGNIKLLPGEVKVFSPYVENNWTWGVETAGGYNPRVFFDWNANTSLGNWDKRSDNQFGVDAISGLDFRAGLQTDHMSYGGGRDSSSRYDFENATGWGWGFLSMRLTDDVTVKCKAQRCVTDVSLPDFRVDLLAGVNTDVASDLLRTYEFKFKDVAVELGSTSVITRRYKNKDILQTPDDPSPGGKSPFAILTMSAKTTRDKRDDSKSWLHNNFNIEGARQDTTKIGNAAQSYDVRLEEVQSYNTYPGVEFDPATGRGFFGAKATSADGVSVVPMYRVPLQPAASLGAWIAGNLVTTSQFPRVNYPLGNSHAHPMVPSNGFSAPSPMAAGQKVLDHSYLMNAALWDRFFFSSAADNNSTIISTKRSRSQVLTDFFTLDKPMLNNRLTPVRTAESATQLATKVNGFTPLEQSQQFARYAMIKNPFNVNSDSVSAWRAILASLRDHSVKGWNNSTFTNADKTAFTRHGTPVVGSSDDANPNNTVNALGQIRWAGYRSLTDAQIESLANKIVAEIRLNAKTDKAPSLSLGEFINRRLGAASEVHALKGILQTAIDQSGVNTANHAKDSQINAVPAAIRTTGVPNTDALLGNTADGAPPILTQGDLLTGLAPIITVRGDTFTIRSYGESRTPDGKSVMARVWCEATVQRLVDYVDSTNVPQDRDLSGVTNDKSGVKDLSPTNKKFGRRFIITSFRWLSPTEV